MKVFISYRGVDEPDRAGRLYDRLVAAFGTDSVFFDVDSILPGLDFRDVIRDTIGQSDAFLVLIGDR